MSIDTTLVNEANKKDFGNEYSLNSIDLKNPDEPKLDTTIVKDETVIVEIKVEENEAIDSFLNTEQLDAETLQKNDKAPKKNQLVSI